MPRQYIRRKTRGSSDPDLPAAIIAHLFDEALPAECDPFLSLNLRFPRPGEAIWNGQSIEAIWRDYGAEVVAQWIADKPGTRPALWWSYTAPEPRQRIGGSGTPRSDVFAYAPSLDYGAPADWITADDLTTWPRLKCAAYDDGDPPTFEAQAAYLARHKLFLPGERRRLRPDSLEPVALADTAER